MAKVKTKFVCNDCGYESPKWMGKCPECSSWDSFVEEVETTEKVKNMTLSSVTGTTKASKLIEVTVENEDRSNTGISELDLVLGGGIVKGSMVLVGGDPGIGKSTLLLQVASNIANQGKKILYISGEESLKQTKMRGDRLGVKSENIYIVAENNMDMILKCVENTKPEFLIIDSIQTTFSPEVTSAPGSVSQVRESTSKLMRLAKGTGIATFIVGHVTKSGAIAGPKVLEHMVDTVLYFEGEGHNIYRILRAVKNRFGSTNEIGMFEMSNAGLKEVMNPSSMFLTNKATKSSGSVIFATVEGSRPVLIEIQALVSETNFNMPRRNVVGLDYNKIVMLIAILEKKMGLALYDQDCYINVVGGMSINEPASDLAIITALTSSFRNFLIEDGLLIFGEVGLTGEVRHVSNSQHRINEAYKLGFSKCIIPVGNLEGLTIPEGLEVHGVKTVEEAFEIIFSR